MRPSKMRPTPVLAATMILAIASQAPAREPTKADDALAAYLQQTLHVEAPVHFRAGSADLNGDGVPETIVFVDEPDFCGTGGCDALILKRDAGGYRTITKLSVVHLPIRVLPSRSHGWRDLGITVAGGGVLVAYEAQLRFDGRSYPTNPTVAPAEPLARMRGHVVLAALEASPFPQGLPTAMDVLRRLDLTSFPNSVGPRRVAGHTSPSDYGFVRFAITAKGASAEEADGRWIISLEGLVHAGPLLNACFRDQAERGGTYHTLVPLSLRHEADGRYSAKIEGAGLGPPGCPSPQPPLVQ